MVANFHSFVERKTPLNENVKICALLFNFVFYFVAFQAMVEGMVAIDYVEVTWDFAVLSHCC